MKFSHSWRRYRKAILALFFCTSLTAAQAVDFMPVNDVTTGMEGIAKTVIVGDTISTFDVKVLGVMKDKGAIWSSYFGKVLWSCYGKNWRHCSWHEW